MWERITDKQKDGKLHVVGLVREGKQEWNLCFWDEKIKWWKDHGHREIRGDVKYYFVFPCLPCFEKPKVPKETFTLEEITACASETS